MAFFFKRVQEELTIAAEGKPIISVSQKPINFGNNICVGDVGRSHHSLFSQVLQGACAAETKYVALAEHDCLYTPEHFNWIPPDCEYFYYNVNHWFVQWGNKREGEYSYMRRRAMSQLVCDRELLVRALKEKVHMLETGFEIAKGQPGACEPGVCDDREAFVKAKDAWIEKIYLEKCKDNPGYKDVGKEHFKARAFKTVMPNLDTQDQTLQFDLLQATQSTLAPSPSSVCTRKRDKTLRSHPLQNESDFSSHEHLTFPSSPAKTGPRHSVWTKFRRGVWSLQRPHLSVVNC